MLIFYTTRAREDQQLACTASGEMVAVWLPYQDSLCVFKASSTVCVCVFLLFAAKCCLHMFIHAATGCFIHPDGTYHSEVGKKKSARWQQDMQLQYKKENAFS